MVNLQLKTKSQIPLEAACISPDHFQGKSLDDISKLPVLDGNRKAQLGDFFEITGTAEDNRIQLNGDCSTVKLVGSGMTFGEIESVGPLGMHAGAEMRGGKLVIHGNSGDWLGAEMRGGLIQVKGNAGHLCGAGYRGSSRGMRGGTILIHGVAGNEVGSHMRRGLIAIGGGVGDFVGMGMIAGTIIISGDVGIRPGAEMKRGTLAFLDHLPKLLPTFSFSCNYRPLFMGLFLKRLDALGFPLPSIDIQRDWQRHCGDLLSFGMGEILFPVGMN